MTLADEILNCDVEPMMTFGPRLAWVKTAIQQAQRFTFEPEAVEAVINLLHSKPSSLLEAAQQFARPPHERMWLEWLTPFVVPLYGDQIRIRRTGVLVRAVNSHRFSLSTAWCYDEKAIRAANAARDPAMRQFVESATVAWSEACAMVDFTEKPVGAVRHLWELPEDPAQAEAQRALERCIGFNVMAAPRRPLDDDIAYGPLSLMEMKLGRKQAFAKLLDVAQEVKPVIGMLILLNSKNCVSTRVSEPPAALNKARIKRGRLPLVSSTMVSIHLGRRDARQATQHGVTAEDIRQHLVMGHFKVRKTGVYWWRNHIRGVAAAGVVKRAGYRVTA